MATTRGTATRARILSAAADLLADRSPRALTVSEVARTAGVYPNQITHHFGSKDRLVIDAAFVRFLRDTTRLQAAGRRATTAPAFRDVLARTALAMPSTGLLVTALGLAQDDDALRERTGTLLAVLFRQSERYLERIVGDHGWTSAHGIPRDARTFWSAVFGATLFATAGAVGGPSDVDVAATVSITD
ncbi:TetR/AcrR family transcriptional regulator C-terminal domain-containing protein [Curtobacterium sp. PhB136]|uniref:TetR/AcrR family transcriptional regulator C-terminal domain-containing protein n=1 Tax=Curtobacterium sp. PhB136 TaxID=2485181 RepID=UPI0010E572E8|nr:TetR/AcrR family transcriptional regulator C-terminal domain-containing protein [Curtobacterium sp. PhB136]TCK60279.1 TetR family transcriptional regulator [Curtobacterium sp. PhB136]